MSSKILLPRYVKKANSWLVTKITTGDKGKEIHQQTWFNTEQAAKDFMQEAR